MHPKKYNLDFISKDSKLNIEDVNIKGKNNSINISNLFYGNIYGVKTKR